MTCQFIAALPIDPQAFYDPTDDTEDRSGEGGSEEGDSEEGDSEEGDSEEGDREDNGSEVGDSEDNGREDSDSGDRRSQRQPIASLENCKKKAF
ncbi:unnamed protein product [Toxocara canis]|uniref:Prothymosin alpha n=1 Tax=Toxocara canis TaxID=6265 RepID=A0A183TYR4_TOXCA|nr:unnamed protein product [Toxocara canis]